MCKLCADWKLPPLSQWSCAGQPSRITRSQPTRWRRQRTRIPYHQCVPAVGTTCVQGRTHTHTHTHTQHMRTHTHTHPHKPHTIAHTTTHITQRTHTHTHSHTHTPHTNTTTHAQAHTHTTPSLRTPHTRTTHTHPHHHTTWFLSKKAEPNRTACPL